MDRSAGGLHHTKKVQYEQYDGDNNQNMDPIAGARESGT
jgi:hypothetical protein